MQGVNALETSSNQNVTGSDRPHLEVLWLALLFGSEEGVNTIHITC